MQTPNLRRYLLLLFGLASLSLFVILGERAKTGPLSIDMRVALWFKAHRSPAELQWAQVVSALTTPIIVLSATVMLLLYLNYWARSWYPCDFIPLALFLSCAIIASLTKPFFDRVRPGAGLSTMFDLEPSYPSSHTLYMAAAGCALYLSARDRRIWYFIPVVLSTGLIGLSRIVLGVHWFTDLVGGVLVAIGIFILYYVLDDWIVQIERDRS